LTGHQDAVGATADRARSTLEWTDRLHSQEHRDCRRLARRYGKMPFDKTIVLNEPESMKSVDPPLVLTEVRSLTCAPYLAKDPVTIPNIRGAEALLALARM
jgi:hypothetical protein